MFGLGVEDSLAAVCKSFLSLLIALSISVGDFNLIFSIVFLEIMTLNLFQFVNPGVMVGRFCLRNG